MRDRGPALPCAAPRRAEQGRQNNEEPPATKNERGMLMRRDCARALCPRRFFSAGAPLTAQIRACPMARQVKSSHELQRGLAAMHRPNVTWVYVAVCNIHGAPPLQWLEQLGRETERPPYRDPALHFHAPRLVALRGGEIN